MTALEHITEWAGLANAATRGPWEHWGEGFCGPAQVNSGWSGGADWSGPVDDRELVADCSMADAARIAASRTAVPAMTAALTAVLERHRHAAPEYPNECADGCQWPCPTVQDIETALAVTP